MCWLILSCIAGLLKEVKSQVIKDKKAEKLICSFALIKKYFFIQISGLFNFNVQLQHNWSVVASKYIVENIILFPFNLIGSVVP